MIFSVKYSFDAVKNTKKPSDSWISILFINPISYLLIFTFANFIKIRHEFITLTSILTGMQAAYFFYHSNLTNGAIFFLLSVLLDASDGKLAKLTNTSSILGRTLEATRDKLVHLSSLLGLSLGTNNLYLGIVYLALLIINTVSSRSFTSTATLQKMKPIKLFGQNAYPIPSVTEWTIILFVLSPLLGNIAWGFYISFLLISLSIFYLIGKFPSQNSSASS